MIQVFLGLGSNMGDRLDNLAKASQLLSPYFQTLITSQVITTSPMYVVDQPEFCNQVIAGETALSAQELLQLTQQIETQLGRVKTYRNGPRPIDIDILYYGNWIINDPNLIIPHPRIQERLFVLQPLVEIAPDWICPVTGKTSQKLLEYCLKNQGS